MTAPEWLTARSAGLAKGLKDWTLMVTLNGRVQWRLDAVPAKGQFTCIVMEMNSGQRLDAGKAYPTRDAAWAGGLEELRAKLGW